MSSKSASFRFNLLETRDDTTTLFGVSIHESATRDGLVALGVIVAFLSLIALVQMGRYYVIQGQQQTLLDQDNLISAKTQRARLIGSHISLLKSLVRGIDDVASSGNDHVVAIAQLGTALRVTPHTWLTSLTPPTAVTAVGPPSWSLKGDSRSFADLSSGLHGLARIGTLSIDAVSSDPTNGGVDYTLRFVAPSITPAPAVGDAVQTVPGLLSPAPVSVGTP